MTCRFELSVLFLILINVTLNYALTYVTVGTNFRSIHICYYSVKKLFILAHLQCIQFIKSIVQCMDFRKEFIPVDEYSGLLLIEKCEEN